MKETSQLTTSLVPFTRNKHLKKKKNLRFVSVYCQILLSTTAYLFVFFLFECICFLSLSLLTFYCSPSFFLFNWIMTTFFHFYVERRRKKWNLSHFFSDLIESIRRKSSLFWNARRKLARINSNTLQLRSEHARASTKQGFWHIQTYIYGFTHLIREQKNVNV